jgi:hypothetical protein
VLDENKPIACVVLSTTANRLSGEFGTWAGVVANVSVSCVVPAATPARVEPDTNKSTMWPLDETGLGNQLNSAVDAPTAPTASEIVTAID